MRWAVVSLLIAALPARAEAPDWFRVYQYAAKTVQLRGCAECQGEPDDVCEVRAGVQARTLEEYAQDRWAAPGRIRLLRSRADPDCAVPAAGAKGLFGARGSVDVAAIRLARSAPSAPLLERAGTPVRGWPRALARRGAEPSSPARPQRASVRLGIVCWPSERGWPAPGAALDAANACEWWLLSTTPAGEPDLAAASFPIGDAFAAGTAPFARAFDRAAALDEAVLLDQPAAPAASKGGEPTAVDVSTRAHPEPVATGAAPDSSTHATAAARARCGEAARTRAATLDRFDQWDSRIRGSAGRSLDRASWTLDAGAWSGHCEEMDVLRGALEQQLSCGLDVQGRCVSATALGAEAR